MTTLKTESGKTLFTAIVEVAGVELKKDGESVVAVLDGEVIGTVEGKEVKTYVEPGAKGKAITVKVGELVGDIDPKTLIGKDPADLTTEEIAALQQYLAEIAGEKVAKPKKETPAKTKAKAAPVEDEDDDEEEEEIELPEGIETYEDLAALGSKELWKEVVQPIVSELEGISSRSKKDEMLAAAAEYYGLTPDEEEEEEKPAKKTKSTSKKAQVSKEEEDEDEDDEYDDEEDEDDLEDDLGEEFDDEDDEDDEDDFDEDEEDDEFDDEDEDDEAEDEEDYDEGEDDDEYDDDEDEDDEDEITEKDVDDLFKAGDKKAIVAFCKQHDITLPKKRLSAAKVKELIKDALFGEE